LTRRPLPTLLIPSTTLFRSHDPTAEHSVEFGDEGRLRLSQCGVDPVDRLRPAGLLDLGLHLRRTRTLFFEGAPGRALGAAPEPFDRRIAAFGAGERHTAILTRGADAGIADEKGRPTIGRPRPAVRQAVSAGAGQCGRRSVDGREGSGAGLGDGDRIFRMRAVTTI